MKAKSTKKALRGVGFFALLIGLAACASNPALQKASEENTAATNELKDKLTTKPDTPATAQVLQTDSKNPPLIVANSADLPATAANASAQSTTTLANPTPADQSASPAAHPVYTNLWDRIRAGLTLPKMDNNPLVARQEQWFVNNPEYMERMLQRANLYLFHIVDEVDKRHMPMEIALLPAIESAYQPHAYSRSRAVGLWQFMPSTGRLYGLKSNWWYDGRRDITASTDAALDYLDKLSKEFNGDWQLALAAYNCGEGKVERAIEHNRRRGLSTAYEDLKLPRETKNYVPKLMAMVHIVSNPAQFGLQLAEIPNSPYFVRVDVGSQIDLGVVAKLANLPIESLYDMNPAFNRWATAPDGPHHLLVPITAKDTFMEGLNALPPEDRVQWARHQVKRGDTLGRVAQRYGVSIQAIKSANNLHTAQLHVGHDLLIPVSGRKLVLAKEDIPPLTLRQVSDHSAGKIRIVHRVRAGETLFSIAKKYRVYVHQLAQWNFMEISDVLRKGQKLLIWKTPDDASASAESLSLSQG